MRDFSVLSDVEFEELVADLVAADAGQNVERFARGRDGGIDLRWKRENGGQAIGQCKHYLRSTFAQLKSAAKAEFEHLQRLNPKQYIFATSQDLTPGQKDSLVQILSPWVRGPADIYGSRDIDGMLTRFSEVEQRYPKLWLATGTQLFWATHSDLASRASALRTRIESTIPLYVTNESYSRGASMLDEQRVCVIAGLPGIGKTTLGYALLADAMARGYEPVEVSADINEAWTALRNEVPQVFLYDDFLGQLTFSERLGKNEDSRLADFISKVSATKSKMLVMTTREYILQDARRTYPKLSVIDNDKHLILELGDYTRSERARILYNHLWHAGLPAKTLQEVSVEDWIAIVDHKNYSPRLIEYCTDPEFALPGSDYVERFFTSLEHPDRLWATGFEDHLSELQRLVAVVLASLPSSTLVGDLEFAHSYLCKKRGVVVNAALFRSALQVMEGTFLAIEMNRGASQVRFHNPSVRAFVLDWLARDQGLVTDLVEASSFFEQVSNLFQFANGYRGGTIVSEPSSRELATAVSKVRMNMVSAFMRLIDSPTPELGANYSTDAGEPVSSWFEDRLIFLQGLPDEFQIPGEWMSRQLRFAVGRWSADTGSKRRAVRLIELLKNNPDKRVSSNEVEEAFEELDAWLKRKLDDTDEDWLPYFAMLEDVQGVDLEDADDVVEAFEEHAQRELDRWHPSPPALDELIEFAEKLNLFDLEDRLREAAKEANAEDEFYDEQRDRSWGSQTVGVVVNDSELRQLFSRLTGSEPSGD